MIKKIYLLSIVFLTLGIFVYNFLTPMSNDDFAACFHFAHPEERITNIIQILSSLKSYYFNWGGGINAGFFHLLIVVFLKKSFFNILNTVFFLILTLLICESVGKRNIKSFLFVLCLIWLFAPNPGDSIFWLPASIQYFWGVVFGIAFILFGNRIKNQLLLFTTALFIGSWTINLSSILIPFFLIKIIQSFFQSKTIHKNQIISFIGLSIGFLILFLAPGNMQRFQNMYVEINIMDRMQDFSNYLIQFLKNIFFLILPVIAIIILALKKNEFASIIQDDYFLIFLCALISPVYMIVAPEYSERTTFSAFIFLLPLILKSFEKLITLIKIEFLKESIYLSIILMTFSSMALHLDSKLIIHQIDLSNNLKIIESKKQYNNELELDVVSIPPNRFTFIYNIRKDKNYIANKHMAAYFDLKSVRAKGDYLKLTFNDVIVGNFNLQSKFENGDLFNNSQMVYNKFDGNSVFFDIPNEQKLDSIIQIEINPRIHEKFKLTKIELYRGNKQYIIDSVQLKRNAIKTESNSQLNLLEYRRKSRENIVMKFRIPSNLTNTNPF
jgi:hypothetical protein